MRSLAISVGRMSGCYESHGSHENLSLLMRSQSSILSVSVYEEDCRLDLDH